MKTIVPTFLLALVVCAGCRTYDIKLTNGMVLTSRGKPKLDEKRHVILFKDADGRTNAIPEFRVVEMGPHSTMTDDDNNPAKFQSVTKK